VTQVWLPEDFPGDLPDGMTAETWNGREPLPESADEVEVIVMPFGVEPDVLAKASALPKLKLIQLRSAGAEAYTPYVADHVTLCNARGAHDPGTSEWVAAAMLAHVRHFPESAVAQHEGQWVRPPFGETLDGKRVLIVGYGSIGAAVEHRLAGWDVTVERVARTARPARAGQPGNVGQPASAGEPEVRGISDLYDLLPAADVVVLLVPVTDETRGLAGARFLAAMRDGALLVNAARGPIVDTDALLAELNSGRLRAALDVTDPEPLPDGHPLWKAPGLLLTPHVGGYVEGGTERAHEMARANLARYAAGEPLENVIGTRGY
jgi:phosphoglycerate dehydrogenase-like enzyme